MKSSFDIVKESIDKQYNEREMRDELISRLNKNRRELRAAIESWLNYTGDNADCEFEEIFEKVLKDN